MARISRVLQKVFAGGAANNGQFGSAQAGTKILSNDLAVIQALAAFDAGWNSATISSSKLPTLEEMQGLHFMTTTQLAYIFQEGLVEYEANTEYHQNSIVKKAGTYELYGSLINTNLGNALPVQADNASWKYLGDLASLVDAGSGAPIGTPIPWITEVEPADYIEADGSAISRVTYAELFTAIGTRYGVGDGSTTFNLPDWRGEFLRGWDHGAGNDPDAASRTDRGDGTTGDNVGTKQGFEIQSHTHTIRGNTGSDGPQSEVAFDESNNTTRTTNATGGNETRPRNVNVMWCIKYQ